MRKSLQELDRVPMAAERQSEGNPFLVAQEAQNSEQLGALGWNAGVPVASSPDAGGLLMDSTLLRADAPPQTLS